MRLRTLSAVAVAALAMTGLTACHTNVGAAAVFNGQRISEATVAKYLTSAAQPVPEQDSNGNTTGTIAPRTYVLGTLLNERLYSEVLAATPTGAPSAGAISSAQQQLLQGTSPDAVTQQYVQHGYQADFATLYLHEQALEQILSTDVQGGLNVKAILDKLRVSVSVNPRYGAWDPTTYSLSTSPNAGLPSFLTLTPGGSTFSTPSSSAPAG